MDRDLRLKQVASAIFSYVFRKYNASFEMPVKLPQLFQPSPNEEIMEHEGKAVLKLCLTLRANFNEVFVKSFPNMQRSIKHYMTFLTSRCLKICCDDPFLSFVVTSAFIAELNLFCCINACYSFMNTASKCLIAIFNRRLNKEFYAKGGWEKLRLFCENFVQRNGQIADAATNSENGMSIDIHSLQLVLHSLEQTSSSSEETTSDSDSSESMEEEESVVEESDSVVEVSEDESDSSTETESSEEEEDSEEDSEESKPPIMPLIKSVHTLNNKNLSSDSEEDESESSEELEPSSLSEDSLEGSIETITSDPIVIKKENSCELYKQENPNVSKEDS